MQNIFRTLKAGSAASLIRNSDFSAPEVRFLGVLPEDIKKYDLHDYPVKENDAQEVRALKKADDALKNDPFFHDKKNKGLSHILHWLLKNKRRCEQQAYFSVNPRDPQMPEKIILDKIKKALTSSPRTRSRPCFARLEACRPARLVSNLRAGRALRREVRAGAPLGVRRGQGRGWYGRGVLEKLGSQVAGGVVIAPGHAMRPAGPDRRSRHPSRPERPDEHATKVLVAATPTAFRQTMRSFVGRASALRRAEPA